VLGGHPGCGFRASSIRLLEVLAAPNKDGVLTPLTADYDFLAIGRKGAMSGRPTSTRRRASS
jgi:hypothetical protein